MISRPRPRATIGSERTLLGVRPTRPNSSNRLRLGTRQSPADGSSMGFSAAFLGGLLLVLAVAMVPGPVAAQPSMQEYAVPAGSHPHDVAPAVDGGVWFTAQSAGYLGWLDPATGDVRQVPLGPRSAPHGAVRDHADGGWVAGVLRLAGRQPHRRDQPRDGSGDAHRPTHAWPGRAPGVDRLARRHLGQRMERGPGGPLRSRL